MMPEVLSRKFLTEFVRVAHSVPADNPSCGVEMRRKKVKHIEEFDIIVRPMKGKELACLSGIDDNNHLSRRN